MKMRYAGSCISVLVSGSRTFNLAAARARFLGFKYIVALVEHNGSDQWVTWYGTNQEEVGNAPVGICPEGCIEVG